MTVAEIIAIGTELTTGAKLDTNSQWLSLELSNIGIPVHFHATMSDDLQAMIETLRTAVQRADIVLITGGLGPTLDDLTRDALAGLIEQPLVLDKPSLSFLENMYSSRNRVMPERNRVQAMFPQSSEPIPNENGTAPGIWLEVPREDRPPCRIAAMPGVPSEMKPMFHRLVVNRLGSGQRVIQRARINCFGQGESNIEEMLKDLTARGSDPDIGITAHEATITMRITAAGESPEECQRKISRADSIIRERLGSLVYGIEDEELEDIVVRQLTKAGQTVSTAESGTGGLLAHRFTEVPGFESSYLGGVIVPTNAAKTHLLDIPETLLTEYGAISEQVALAMAEHCRDRFQTDYALAVTECPLTADSEDAAPPVSFVALVGEQVRKVHQLSLLGNPAIMKSRTAKAASNLLRLHLASAD